MSSIPASSAVGLKSFTLFSALPAELRIIIWRLSPSPRVVELLQSTYNTGFYSKAPFPAALMTCQESREAVLPLYPKCFNAFNRSARVLFNFEIDTLYLDKSQIFPIRQFLVGILKEKELARLKFVAIDKNLLAEGPSGKGIRDALKAMTQLKEFKVVHDIETALFPEDQFSLPKEEGQIVFLDEKRSRQRAWCLDATWPDETEDGLKLPDVKKYKSWRFSEAVEVEAVYGWRSCFPSSPKWKCDDFANWSLDWGEGGDCENHDQFILLERN